MCIIKTPFPEYLRDSGTTSNPGEEAITDYTLLLLLLLMMMMMMMMLLMMMMTMTMTMMMMMMMMKQMGFRKGTDVNVGFLLHRFIPA